MHPSEPGATIIRADCSSIPLADECVDLVVTSPPYFALRAYQDGDEAYDGQIGSEPTPQAFLESLWSVTDELKRVLKPTGSIFVNLGDKYAGSGGHNNSELARAKKGGGKYSADMVEGYLRDAPTGYNKNSEVTGFDGKSHDVPNKSLMLLPERYRIGCVDLLDLIARATIIWSKPNGLPESVDDRVRRSHEDWVHLTKQGDYYTAIDEIREAHLGVDNAKSARGPSGMNRGIMTGQREEPVGNFARDPAGKLPSSVWEVATEPLAIPDLIKEEFGTHFAAFPTEWPRRLITAWSPIGICLDCGQGRVPVLGRDEEGEVTSEGIVGYACPCCPQTRHKGTPGVSGKTYAEGVADGDYVSNEFGGRLKDRPKVGAWTEYHFKKWKKPPPTRPAVVLDPFGGTGTTAMIARALGRYGVSLDLSEAYCRLARWRVFESGHWKKANDKEAEKTVQHFDF